MTADECRAAIAEVEREAASNPCNRSAHVRLQQLRAELAGLEGDEQGRHSYDTTGATAYKAAPEAIGFTVRSAHYGPGCGWVEPHPKVTKS